VTITVSAGGIKTIDLRFKKVYHFFTMKNTTPFGSLILSTGLNDYEIARELDVSRSAIRSLRTGQTLQPSFTLGIRLMNLAGHKTPASCLKLMTLTCG
jgi:hypothetical protein